MITGIVQLGQEDTPRRPTAVDGATAEVDTPIRVSHYNDVAGIIESNGHRSLVRCIPVGMAPLVGCRYCPIGLGRYEKTSDNKKSDASAHDGVSPGCW